jgi:hypothetical protein
MLKFPKRIKRPLTKGVTEPEKAIQERAEYYLDAMGMRYIHIPSYMQKWILDFAPGFIKKVASIYLKGIPDLVIFHQNGRYLLLELKTEKGTVSQSQESWSKGLKLEVAYGWVEAEKILKDFCNLE